MSGPLDDILELRPVGGRLSAQALSDLALAAGAHADGHLHLTDRAGLELRGVGIGADEELLEAIRSAGLRTQPSHTILVSAFTGRVGGQADLWPVAEELDELLKDANLARDVVVVLDDGRGDLVDTPQDLGVMAVDPDSAQVRVGSDHWGEVLELIELPQVLHDLATRERPVGQQHARDLRTQVRSLPAPHGIIWQDDGRRLEHVKVPGGDLTHDLATQVLARARQDVIVTPWRSLLLVDLEAP